MDRRRLAILTVALMLAAPGTAVAQSAGDEQYEDPFAGDDQEQAAPTPTPTPAPDTSVSSDDSSSATAQATPAPAPASGSAAPAAQEQLPRTGDDPILPAVAGFWMLLGGVALRAKVRTR